MKVPDIPWQTAAKARHGPFLGHLPEDAERGRLDTGGPGLGDAQHCQLPGDGAGRQVPHADHLLHLLRLLGFGASLLVALVTHLGWN